MIGIRQLFFFDIDGTLAHRGQIPASNRYVLGALRQKGHLTFICTGRPVAYAQQLFGDLVDGIIANNGRYGTLHGSVMYRKPFTLEERKHYRSLFASLGCPYVFLGNAQGYAGGFSPQEMADASRRFCWEGFFTDQWELSEIDAYSFDLYYRDDAHFAQIEQALKGQVVLNDHVGAHSADGSTCDFDKGHGIAAMLQALSLPQARSFAFGDGQNDVCMFRSVDIRVAMGNAVPALKEAADFVTKPFDQDGLLYALQHYGVL